MPRPSTCDSRRQPSAHRCALSLALGLCGLRRVVRARDLSPVRPMRAGTSAKFAVPTIARCSPPLLKEEDAALADRAVAAAVYLLPAIDGFAYGYVYANIPPVGAIAYLFLPLVNTFNSLPFVGLILS